MEKSLERLFLESIMGRDTPCPKVGSQNGQGCLLKPARSILQTETLPNGKKLVVITPTESGIPEAAQVWIDKPREDTTVLVWGNYPDAEES